MEEYRTLRRRKKTTDKCAPFPKGTQMPNNAESARITPPHFPSWSSHHHRLNRSHQLAWGQSYSLQQRTQEVHTHGRSVCTRVLEACNARLKSLDFSFLLTGCHGLILPALRTKPGFGLRLLDGVFRRRRRWWRNIFGWKLWSVLGNILVQLV
jgi:hypothetical protein